MMQRHDRFLRRLPIPILSLLTVSFFTACALRLFSPSIFAASQDSGWGLSWLASNTSLGSSQDRTQHNDIDLSDPEAPFVSWPLARVCEETTWVEGLVFICDNNSGGVGNIRNYIQTCLRYALEAGATGLVIPRIRKRSDKNLADLFSEYLPFDYMFDEAHFRQAFNTSCPKISLYASEKEIPNVTPETEIELIKPKNFGARNGGHPIDQDRHTDRFGDRFRKWLGDGIMPVALPKAQGGKQPNDRTAPSTNKPRLIRFEWGVIWEWPVYRDGPEFAATFGHILKFNDAILRLGKTALERMRAISEKNGGARGFLGAHLRTEADALDFWPRYHQQAQSYLQRAGQRGFRAAYLATGNATEAGRFRKEAMDAQGMKVFTKEDLLSGQDQEDLLALSWDQRAIVDFLILLGSDYFVGVMPSSFSVYVAVRRHLRIDGLYMRPFKVGTEGDGLSYLVGKYDHYWDEWLFMFDGMWP
ncbi:GDP-fucose protein O-fucosyltransferase [Microdochium nivale]|nr:GDP-fucose protein O-fucosyltransferase [Microdochium nivale]